MSKEIDAFVETLVKEGKGTREQIIQQFANSDDSDLVTYATNQNKPKREEAEQSYVKMFTEKHPTLGVSPADILLYGGLTGAALAAGKKVVGGLSDFVTDKFKGGDVPTQPAPSTSTQDMMAKPTPVANAPVNQAAPTGLPSTTQQFSVAGEPQPTIQYGQQKINQPTGVPSPVPAPAGQAAPVEPPPMSELERIRLEKAQVELENAKAKAAREQQLHEKRLADMEARAAKQDTQKLSKLQGQSSAEVDMQKSSVRAEQGKSVDAVIKSNVKKYPPVQTETPVVGAAVPAPAPAVVEVATPINATAPTAKQASKIKEITLPPEWKGKGMNWLSSAVGIEGAKQFIDIYNNGKPFNTHDEMKAVYDNVMSKPSYSTIPKSTRQDRGITSGEREQYKIVPGAVAPPSGGGGGAGPVIRGGGGGATGIGRAGEEIHNLNPLKL